MVSSLQHTLKMPYLCRTSPRPQQQAQKLTHKPPNCALTLIGVDDVTEVNWSLQLRDLPFKVSRLSVSLRGLGLWGPVGNFET